MTTELINGLNFPEGPAFDKDGGIWLVEKEAGNLIYYRNGQYQRIHVGGHPNGIAIDQDGIIWFCDSQQNAIRQYAPIQREHCTIVDSIDGEPLKMPNDLCFDEHGNLLFTCPGDRLDDGTGYLCCLSTDRKLYIIHSGMYYPNGLAFSSDQRTLYIAETGSKWIWSSQWNVRDKKLEEVKKFAYVGGDVGPDGMAIDTENNLYIALYGGRKITVLNIEGLAIDEIPLNHPNPTNCALDPSGIQGLTITEADKGQLLQFKTNKKGLL
ncbi:SMP-30/gluconolactonase/LRE family protein [Sphingobacterium tabacisoli]|uniref:SMP-30/gluconolactonase/LRE family protein n=1 Tax=Sphingobacterium tabacisoli TaxID=2044855 RepID=A0ABW5L884_9SPHI|nr:SMP-30/gluconolactonase/LRE family protein [Sphingobacterium tabacisoli]